MLGSRTSNFSYCECWLLTDHSCPLPRKLPLAEWKPPKLGTYSLPQGKPTAGNCLILGYTKDWVPCLRVGPCLVQFTLESSWRGQTEAGLWLTPHPWASPSLSSPGNSSLLFPGEHFPGKSRALQSLSQALPLANLFKDRDITAVRPNFLKSVLAKEAVEGWK